MIPDFTEFGYLPEGVYPCNLNEIKARFGQSNPSPKRSELYDKLSKFIIFIGNQHFKSIFIDGSFISNKEIPGDIDAVIELKNESLNLLNSIDQRIFDKDFIAREYDIDMYLYWDTMPKTLNNLTQFFQYIRKEDMQTKNIPVNSKKGILKVIL